MDPDNADVHARGLELSTDEECKKRNHFSNKILIATKNQWKQVN